MTDDEIKEYRNAIGKLVQLFGYTSTSIKQSLGMSYMWDNKDSGHKKVLLNIQWKSDKWGLCHYYLDAGAYKTDDTKFIKSMDKLTTKWLEVRKNF